MNRSKKKGTAFEVAVAEFMQTHGLPDVERRAQQGALDRGDLSGIREWIVSVKNRNDMDLGVWMTEATKQALNAKVHRYAVVHKRRMKGTRDAYATVPLWLLCELLAAWLAARDETVEAS